MKKYYKRFINFIFVFCFFLFLIINTNAQKEGNVWHFGYGAGIDFNKSNPIPITNGVINAGEGCSSIADSNGNLLFYTNGVRVWNKIDVLMPNGTGLMGHTSSAQSALIVPQPYNDSIYYIFTVDAVVMPNKGFRYSKVNMNLNGGLGDVEVSAKNIFVLSSTTEQLSATYHANGRDIWIIVHHYNNANFYAYLLTPTGLITSPVISTIGEKHNGVGMSGHLKVSPDGRKLACCVVEKYLVQLFDFDNATGLISKLITTLAFNTLHPYGCEFSPDGTKLYITSSSDAIKEDEINQYDISTNDSAEITNSKTIIASRQGITGSYSSLQLAPDKKIYIASWNAYYLSVIHAPNKTGKASNYESKGFYLAGKRSAAGLPNFISNLFYFPYENTICFGDSNTTCFEFTGIQNYDSLIWDFGDGTPAITVFENNTCHFYSNLGTYEVQLVYWVSGKSYTLKQIVIVPHEITSTDTISICQGDSILLEGKFRKEAGEYKDIIVGGNRYGCDSIVITNLEIHNQAISTNTVSICQGDSILLAGKFRKEEGEYKDTIIGGSSFGCDSIVVTTLSIIQASTGSVSTSICRGDSIMIGGRYRKQEGEYTDTLHGASSNGCDSIIIVKLSFTIPEISTNNYEGCPGYSVTIGSNIYNTSGIFKDVVNGCDTVFTVLTIHPNPDFKLVKTDDECNQQIGSIEATELTGTPPYAFIWSNGETGSSINNLRVGVFQLIVKDEKGCAGTKSATVFNLDDDCEPVFLIPNAFSPNGDGLNDVFEITSRLIRNFNIQIYNRWGEQMFTTTDTRFAWDGTFKGKLCPEGVYMVIIHYESFKEIGITHQYKGSLQLVR